MLQKLALLNNVLPQIKVGALCDKEQLQNLSGSNTLVFCDIEGGELDLLDPIKIPNLKFTDLIVESHDCVHQGITNLLIERFKLTHKIDIQSDTDRKWDDYSWPNGFNSRMKRGWTNEGRPKGMLWLRMTSTLSS
jgi:hypothetical protein